MTYHITVTDEDIWILSGAVAYCVYRLCRGIVVTCKRLRDLVHEKNQHH